MNGTLPEGIMATQSLLSLISGHAITEILSGKRYCLITDDTDHRSTYLLMVLESTLNMFTDELPFLAALRSNLSASDSAYIIGRESLFDFPISFNNSVKVSTKIVGFRILATKFVGIQQGELELAIDRTLDMVNIPV